jgi:hypothetical protein
MGIGIDPGFSESYKPPRWAGPPDPYLILADAQRALNGVLVQEIP